MSAHRSFHTVPLALLTALLLGSTACGLVPGSDSEVASEGSASTGGDATDAEVCAALQAGFTAATGEYAADVIPAFEAGDDATVERVTRDYVVAFGDVVRSQVPETSDPDFAADLQDVVVQVDELARTQDIAEVDNTDLARLKEPLVERCPDLTVA